MGAGCDRLGFEEVLTGRERHRNFTCSVFSEREGEVEEERKGSIVCGGRRRILESLTFSGLSFPKQRVRGAGERGTSG